VTATTLDRIETARMIGERYRPEHAPDLAVLMLDPRVAPTLWPGPHSPTKADVRRSVSEKIAHWERYGFGMWLLRDRATGAVVGRGGLQHTAVTGAQEVEVGWATAPERWGEGLATELATASIEVAFGPLGLDSVIAYSLATNTASRRVMEKSGFVYERELNHASLAHVLYRRRPG
jgi:[ribosomal protein S5]-alanine N-acetyltransferase